MSSDAEMELITFLATSHTVTAQFDVAAATLLVWDILLTFDKEVNLVWRADWNFMKALYLFQRYLPLLDSVYLTINYQLGINVGPGECARLIKASGWLAVVGFATSEVILTLRAWAVWNRNRLLTIILLILWCGVWIPIAVFEGNFLASLKLGTPPYAGFLGCFIIGANSDLFLCILLLMIWNIVVFALIAFMGIRINAWKSTSRLSQLIYRDGAIYYFYVFVLSILNVIAIVTFPVGYQFVLLPMERCLHSILASRVLLNLRLYCHGETTFSERLTDFVIRDLDGSEDSL
ncbi:hypothetical protein GALMADRAFT_216830 [Galerina marginata CBS 339.88]|uniref:DUF6533 domain-containing protein n=1 Tax=Galerina marginata (strain CBS 339.88) TaxID=685588 RepID=A0A067S7E9_GALM3|nr:hypothetical protein GALMADRAFT_216830 [Galerina marginata CBS 339.88]